jgi:hypothetical protein
MTLKLENPRAGFVWTDIEWGKEPDPKVFRLTKDGFGQTFCSEIDVVEKKPG